MLPHHDGASRGRSRAETSLGASCKEGEEGGGDGEQHGNELCEDKREISHRASLVLVHKVSCGGEDGRRAVMIEATQRSGTGLRRASQRGV